MSELSELYQEIILDHGKRPRNLRAIAAAQHQAEGYNPLCGDRITIYANVDERDQTISDVSFEGAACAICTASASLLTQEVKGESVDAARAAAAAFREMLTGPEHEAEQYEEQLGTLAVLAGVRRYPMRVKCATLPWHTLRAALEDRGEPVTTE